MDDPADFSVEPGEAGDVVALTGDWTAVALGQTGNRLAADLEKARTPTIDLRGIGRCDTAGAFAILTAAQGRVPTDRITASKQTGRLLELVSQGMRAAPVPEPVNRSLMALLERLGRGLINVWHDTYDTMGFLGHLLVACGRVIMDPRRMRWAAVFSLAERAGLDAIPIVTITTFFIGAVVFAVELIGIAVLREFNIIIPAVLLAGRSASSFAAEIGSMKMNQEVDAMLTMGVDPFEALVLPRFLALLVTIPLLTFIATLAGLAGGLLVSWAVLDLSPSFFLQRIVDNVGVTHFWVGLSKAPVMAIVIAGIGCRQGMEVEGDVETLGRRVTAAVVHSIFSIILIDALFALLYMELHV